MKRTIGILMPLLLALTCPVAASAAEVVAYVVDYNGGDGTIRIRRGDRGALSVAVGLPLEAGDVVEVVSGGTHGTAYSVSIDDGSAVKVIEDKSSPFRIGQPSLAGSTLGKWRQVMEIVSWTAKSGVVSANTREGNAIHAAALESQPVKVYDGDRTLRLEWTGGTAPFRWEIVNNGTAVASGISGTERKLALPVKLNAGTAELKVADSGKDTARQSRSYTLAVLPSPKGTVPQQRSGAATPLQRISAAVELSRLEGGAFVFEAIQQLSHANATRAETALREALQLGERP